MNGNQLAEEVAQTTEAHRDAAAVAAANKQQEVMNNVGEWVQRMHPPMRITLLTLGHHSRHTLPLGTVADPAILSPQALPTQRPVRLPPCPLTLNSAGPPTFSIAISSLERDPMDKSALRREARQRGTRVENLESVKSLPANVSCFEMIRNTLQSCKRR